MEQSDFLSQALVQIAIRKKKAKSRYERNKEIILSIMKDAGIPKISVGYCGYGDSGCVETIEANGLSDGKTVDLENSRLSVISESSKFEDGKWIEREETQETSLHNAVEGFAYDWLEAMHPGWENNDGADGEIVFDLEQGKVFITHNSHYTETDTTEDEL